MKRPDICVEVLIDVIGGVISALESNEDHCQEIVIVDVNVDGSQFLTSSTSMVTLRGIAHDLCCNTIRGYSNI